MHQPKTYPSAVDKWLAAILIGAPLLPIAIGIILWVNVSAKIGIIEILTGVFAGALIALFAVPCVYTLDDEKLTIRGGIIRYKVPLAEIRHVEKSNSLWSAPALSLKRVKIITTRRTYLISPADRDTFIADLRARITQ